jgi:hypothetical protein
MVYRDNRFIEIDKLLLHAQQSPLMKQSKKFARKLLPKKRLERKKIKRSLVE